METFIPPDSFPHLNDPNYKMVPRSLHSLHSKKKKIKSWSWIFMDSFSFHSETNEICRRRRCVRSFFFLSFDRLSKVIKNICIYLLSSHDAVLMAHGGASFRIIEKHSKNEIKRNKAQLSSFFSSPTLIFCFF